MLPVAAQVPGWDATILAAGVSAPDLFNPVKARRTPAEQSTPPSATRGMKKADRELDFVFIGVTDHRCCASDPSFACSSGAGREWGAVLETPYGLSAMASVSKMQTLCQRKNVGPCPTLRRVRVAAPEACTKLTAAISVVQSDGWKHPPVRAAMCCPTNSRNRIQRKVPTGEGKTLTL